MAIHEVKRRTTFNEDVDNTAWARRLRANEGAPNVIFIVQDDSGFGQIGCYGSPIATPCVNALAKNGLVFTNMHTAGLCAPTGSCLLTGRNHHSNGVNAITDGSLNIAGGHKYMPFENGLLSEILLQHGYSTYAIGKWDLTPADQISAAGPYDRRPLGRGFERYYGFLGGNTNQYYPELTYDNHSVQTEKTPPGYHLTEDLVNKAIGFITDSKQVAPKKPFFLYFATGAVGAPHHVPREWANKYCGKFDDGWDIYREKVFKRQKELGIMPKDAELSRHDPDVAEWKTLSTQEKKLYARMMEVFAGFLTYTDYQYGRLFEMLKLMGQWENTLIMFISSNGASAEGGPTGAVNENKLFNNVPDSPAEKVKMIRELGGPATFNHYPWGWANAGNAPFRRWKGETYRGATNSPFIVHWPKGIEAKGELRTQFAHTIDIVPTVLDALGIEPPASIRSIRQTPIEGDSFAHVLDNAKAPSKHVTQYFEIFGNRSIYHDGWRAVCPWPAKSFKESGHAFEAVIDRNTFAQLDAEGWELYHIENDVAENENVAAENKERLTDMIALWYAEARKYRVLPLDSRAPLNVAEGRSQFVNESGRHTYYPGTQPVPISAGPSLINQPHSLTADVHIPRGGAEGALLSAGGVHGGYAFYVQSGKLHYVYNYVGTQYFHVESSVAIPEGRHKLRFEFEVADAPDIEHGKGSPGRAQLYIDGKLVGQGGIALTMPVTLGVAGGIVCGADTGSTVWDKYEPPFKFTGTLYCVTVDVGGPQSSID